MKISKKDCLQLCPLKQAAKPDSLRNLNRAPNPWILVKSNQKLYPKSMEKSWHSEVFILV